MKKVIFNYRRVEVGLEKASEEGNLPDYLHPTTRPLRRIFDLPMDFLTPTLWAKPEEDPDEAD